MQLTRTADVEHRYTHILVKEVNWLGDMVMSLPALTALHRAFPAARISVLVKAQLSGFFDGFPWIHEVLPYDIAPGWRGLRDRRSLIQGLRSCSFDAAVVLPRSFESALWMALAGIPERIGVAAEARSGLLTRAVRVDTKDPSRHQAQAWLDLVRLGLGAVGSIDLLDLQASATHVSHMKTWLGSHRKRTGPLIGVAPAAAFGPAKEWPAESYATLINHLDADGFETVLIGGPSERESCAALAGNCHTRPLIAAGETGIGELIALLSLCQGFVGNDSGAMHLAGALGIPTVGIFGSTNPTRTGPLGPLTRVLFQPPECSPCLQRTCRFGHYECLRRITPEAVLASLTGLLRRADDLSSTDGP